MTPFAVCPNRNFENSFATPIAAATLTCTFCGGTRIEPAARVPAKGATNPFVEYWVGR
jgi:hypothetical protein